MSSAGPDLSLLEEHRFRIYREECERSDILHCPACDGPVVEDLHSQGAVEEMVKGFVPFHRGCRLQPRSLNVRDHWKNEARKHRRALEEEVRRDVFLDWVEGTVTNFQKGDLAHCPECDLPFNWDTDGAQVQFETGFTPGHPACSKSHHEHNPNVESDLLERVRLAS